MKNPNSQHVDVELLAVKAKMDKLKKKAKLLKEKKENERKKLFSDIGEMLAKHFNITSKEQAEKIIDAISENNEVMQLIAITNESKQENQLDLDEEFKE